ncbi:MAG: YraN family protein [Nitrospirae bacterium]|nr:YraN family protein [Nitrospirota bacterium]
MIKRVGRKGEDAAADYLSGIGHKILHRNYRTPLGEADIITSDKDVLVFVEVKARTGTAFGEPFEAVNSRKQHKLKKIALYYLKLLKAERPVRFDVVSIISRNGKNEIKHIIEAF